MMGNSLVRASLSFFGSERKSLIWNGKLPCTKPIWLREER